MSADRPTAPPSRQAKGSPILPRLAAMLTAILVLSGCTAGISPNPRQTTSPTEAPSSSSASQAGSSPSPTPAAFPVTLKDDEGTSVTIAARPQHIVSLSPANTEIVWALGAGSRQVGGTDADDYPKEAAALPHVASFSGVDVEKIVSLGTDLVLAAGNGFNPPDAIQRLRSLGIPVLVLYAADVPGVLADIELAGDAIGEGSAARALTAGMRKRILAIAEAAGRAPTRPRTFYELDASAGIFGPADGSFIVNMIALAGGDPVTTGSTTVFQISLERLVAADPQVILLGDAAYGASAAEVKARPGWGGMTAVKNGAIEPVDDVVVTRPGPRLADGLLDLARAIHPDLGM